MSLILNKTPLALRGECRRKRNVKAHSVRSPSPRPSRHTQKAALRHVKRPLVSKIDIVQRADVRHTVEYWEIGNLFSESLSSRDSQTESQKQISVSLDILHFADEGLSFQQRQKAQQLTADGREVEYLDNGESSSAMALQLASSIRAELDAMAATAAHQLAISTAPADVHQALAKLFAASKSLASRQNQLVQLLKAAQKPADADRDGSSDSTALKSSSSSSSSNIADDRSKADSPGSSRLNLVTASQAEVATTREPTPTMPELRSDPFLAGAIHERPATSANVAPVMRLPAPAAAATLVPAPATPRTASTPTPHPLPRLSVAAGNHTKKHGIKAVHMGAAVCKAKVHREMEDRHVMATVGPMASVQQQQQSAGALSMIAQQQEDAAAASCGAAVAGVFDGHGGWLTAQHAATFIPELVAGGLNGQGVQPAVPGAPSLPAGTPSSTAEAFDKALTTFDAWWRRASETNEWTNHHGYTTSGSTAVLALVKEKQLTVANVGDSVAVLVRGGQAVRLSSSHSAGGDVEETQRVLLAGGLVASVKPGTPPRVWKSNVKYGHTGLMMTRSLGDFSFKWPQPLVIAKPHLMAEDLHSDDQLVLLVSDGVTDVLTDCAMVEVALAALNQERAAGSSDEQLAHAVACAVVAAAKQRGSKDDITAVSMLLDWE